MVPSGLSSASCTAARASSSTTIKAKLIHPVRYCITLALSPARGSWLDFEFDAKDNLFVRIDRRRKLPASIILRALDFTSRTILATFSSTSPSVLK
ncbi:hypothetical protein ACLK2C_21260 [Escherichia coli]